MNCLVYRLRFKTAAHFGSSESALSLYTSEDHFRADTLFSALCHTAAALQGDAGVEKLVDKARAGALLFSDSMPWQGSTYYLPKPCYNGQTDRELPSDRRKAMKKLVWIPAERMQEYCTKVKKGELFTCQQISFGKTLESTKAMVRRQDETLPYPVGLFHFRENCGLYFLAGVQEQKDIPWLTQLVEALGVSGIGGKVTAGYGKFVVEEVVDVTTQPTWRAVTASPVKKRNGYVLLTTSLPREEEMGEALQDASFQLIRRAGFAAADNFSSKKRTQYFVGAGAMVQKCYSGDVYTIGSAGTHSLYRYGKPLFWGVDV